MTQKEAKYLLKIGLINTRYVADATGISMVNIHKFKNDSTRGMVAKKFTGLVNKLEKDGVKIITKTNE